MPGGLNANTIIQQLQSAGNTTTSYATETFVTNTLNDILTQGPTVDINITGNGLCVFSGISGSSKTIVDIGISSSLTDLLDVNVPTPATDQYLKWSGTEWVAGSGVSNFSITDLTNFVAPSGALTPDAFLRVNNQGTSIIQDTNDVISDVITVGGGGITINTPSTGVRSVASDISSLAVASASQDNTNNYFSIETTTNATRKMQKNQIKLEGFDQGNFVRATNISTSVTGGGASTILSHTTTGPCVTIILDTTDILLSSGGTASPLPITRGGTSATNIVDAQTNLGLSINNDIIGYNRGEFQNSLNGDNIRLIGGLSGTSIVSGGTGYGGATYTGTCLLSATGFDFHVNVNIVSGEVTGINNITPPLFLAENVNGVSLSGSGGSGAVVDIGLCYSYISFGVSIGDNNYEDGYGLRYLPGSSLVQFKSSDTAGWVALTNQFGVSGLTDVSASSPNEGDVLIYDGVSRWVGTSMVGTSPSFSLASTGEVSIIITPEDITSTPTITSDEYETLSGMCGATGTIQEQLDDKIQVNSTLTYGDVIMYSNTTTPGVSNFTVVPAGTGTASYNFLKQTDSSPGASGAIFENLFHGFDSQPSGTTPGTSFRFCILDEGTSQANSYTLRDTSDFLTSGTSTGLDANASGQIALNYNQLDQVTSVDPANLLTFGTSSSSGTCYVQSISVEDFLTSSIGETEEGLCISGGNIQLKIPTVANPASITSTYDGQIAYFYNATTPGTSVLAVNYGGNWYGTCVSLVT